MQVDFYIVKEVLSSIARDDFKEFAKEGKWKRSVDNSGDIKNSMDYLFWLLNILVEADLITKVRHKDKKYLNCDYQLTYRGTNFMAMLNTDYIWDYVRERMKILNLYPSFNVVEVLGEKALEQITK